MNKNTGLILEPLQPTDWLMGSSGIGLEIRQPDSNWTANLPTGEKQRRGDVDKMWCVTASAENTCETEFGYAINNKTICVEDLQWLEDNGYLDEFGKPDFSDRFTAIMSKTTGHGNSCRNVAQSIHEYGLIPEKMLPYRKAMSWRECYGYDMYSTPNRSLITQAMIDLGKEFLERFPVNYEFINGGTSAHNNALKYNPLQVCVFAWNGMSNGVYTRTTNGINHAVEKNNINQIYDTYEPYIKTLASNFIYTDYAVRYLVQFRSDVKKKLMLQRKKNTQEVFLAVGNERVWIKSADDFEFLRKAQPVKDIEWANVEEVDEFNIPFEGRIIGKPDFSISDFLKQLFGKISGK